MSIFESTNKKLDEVLAKKKVQSFEQDRTILLKSVATDLAKMMEPVFERTLRSIADKQVINIQPPAVNLPAPKVNVSVPDINVPEPKVTVNVPRTIIPDFPKIPKLEWPDGKMPIEGWVQLMGVSVNNPLPVQLRDANGNPIDLSASLTQVVGSGGSGGRSNYLTISKILDSTGNAYSTANPMPVVITSGATATTAVQNLNADGTYRDTFPVQGTVAVSGVTATVATANIDSTGVQYSGSNPMPVYNVAITGSGNSTMAVGDLVSDAADTGSAPVKIGGIARTANPTAVAAGDRVSATYDDLGRQVMRPMQVRDLITTAYVSLATGSAFGTETTLLASGSGFYLDLIYIKGTNDSDAAIKIDLRASTGGTVCDSIEIPAGGMSGYTLPVAYPAPFSDHTWTVDAPDVTGTNVTISALFSKEI